MRHPALLVCLALAAGSAAASGIQRCEDAQGRPTYTNGTCPPGTQATRAVDTAPPVSDADRAAAQNRSRSEVERARALSREEERERAQVRAQEERERKVEAAAAERCAKARRDLRLAQLAREDLAGKQGRIEQRQRADRLIRRQEEEVARLCAGS